MTEIFLSFDCAPDRVRALACELDERLGDTGRVRVPEFLMPELPPGASPLWTIYVDVSDAETEDEALKHVQPLLSRELLDLLRYGTWTATLIVPA